MSLSRHHGFPVSMRVFHDPELSPLYLYGPEPELLPHFWRRPPTGAQSFFSRLMGDMQAHLDEVDRMRTVLVDAFPQLSLNGEPVPVPVGERRRGSRAAMAMARSPDGRPAHRYFLDVRGFGPDELTVRLDGRKLTVLGRHELRKETEDGCCCHEFREVRREVLLPDDANLDAVTCSLAQDGRLSVEAPSLRVPLPAAHERGHMIPIAVGRGGEEAAAPAAGLEGGEWATHGAADK